MSSYPAETGNANQVMVMRNGERVWEDPPRTPIDELRDEIKELRARIVRLEEGAPQAATPGQSG
jgi:nicotinamide mononucleotide adenylyltransferase